MVWTLQAHCSCPPSLAPFIAPTVQGQAQTPFHSTNSAVPVLKAVPSASREHCCLCCPQAKERIRSCTAGTGGSCTVGAMEQLVLRGPGFCLTQVLLGWPLATGLGQQTTQGTEIATSYSACTHSARELVLLLPPLRD